MDITFNRNRHAVGAYFCIVVLLCRLQATYAEQDVCKQGLEQITAEGTAPKKLIHYSPDGLIRWSSALVLEFIQLLGYPSAYALRQMPTEKYEAQIRRVFPNFSGRPVALESAARTYFSTWTEAVAKARNNRITTPTYQTTRPWLSREQFLILGRVLEFSNQLPNRSYQIRRMPQTVFTRLMRMVEPNFSGTPDEFVLAAHHHFGTWEQAVRAIRRVMGSPIERVQRGEIRFSMGGVEWTEEKVTRILKQLEDQDRLPKSERALTTMDLHVFERIVDPLYPSEAVTRRGLKSAIRFLFGTWRRAIREIGFQKPNAKGTHAYTPEDIFRVLQQLHRRGFLFEVESIFDDEFGIVSSVLRKHVPGVTTVNQFYEVCKGFYGSSRNALLIAGRSWKYQVRNSFLTESQILDVIGRLASQRQSFEPVEFMLDESGRVANSVYGSTGRALSASQFMQITRRLFGSWEKALSLKMIFLNPIQNSVFRPGQSPYPRFFYSVDDQLNVYSRTVLPLLELTDLPAEDADIYKRSSLTRVLGVPFQRIEAQDRHLLRSVLAAIIDEDYDPSPLPLAIRAEKLHGSPVTTETLHRAVRNLWVKALELRPYAFERLGYEYR